MSSNFRASFLELSRIIRRRQNARAHSRELDRDALHFIQRNLIAGAIVQFCGPRRLVGGDGLGVFDRSAVLDCFGGSIARGDYEWELARRTKLAKEIERTRKLLPGRQVEIIVPAEVSEQKIYDLPAGVHLRPGELRIEFNRTQELLQRLFELSQAILNDYQRLGEICESESLNHYTMESPDHRDCTALKFVSLS